MVGNRRIFRLFNPQNYLSPIIPEIVPGILPNGMNIQLSLWPGHWVSCGILPEPCNPMHTSTLLSSANMSAYCLTFENQSTARLMDLPRGTSITTAIQELLPIPRRTLVIVGGAKGLSDTDYVRLEALFTTVICPFAEAHDLVVIDGGTDCGVMRLMGQARSKVGATFPLLGVVVKAMTYIPGETPTHPDQAPLELNHSHFLWVPGQEWGDESGWIARVADTVAGEMASVTLLVNGGDIALHQDLPNSLQRRRPVLVLAESGRAADVIAAALARPEPHPQLAPLVNTGLVQAIKLSDAMTTANQTLEDLFQFSTQG